MTKKDKKNETKVENKVENKTENKVSEKIKERYEPKKVNKAERVKVEITRDCIINGREHKK